MWASVSGECTLDGTCVKSPNYPHNYDDSQECTLAINSEFAGPIRVESFDTQLSKDLLWVNGVGYSGNTGPSDITPTTSVRWTSDGSYSRSGWSLCMQEALVVAAMPTPVVAAMPTPAPPAAGAEVAAMYTTDEMLPSNVTASDLMHSIVYVGTKILGLAAALSVPAPDITILGFTLASGGRRLSGASVSQITVSTSFTVKTVDTDTAISLATTIAGASAAIEAQTESTMAAADWTTEPVITVAPVMTAPVVDSPVVTTAAVPTPWPTASSAASAKGDPHLVNIYGQRFDLMQPGLLSLIHVPRFATAASTLLDIQAEVQRLGATCADMYIQSINVTGAWALVPEHPAGVFFSATRPAQNAGWQNFGQVKLKVLQGHTASGIAYLNFLIRSLSKVDYSIGGLLGDDDHSDVSTADPGCRKSISI